jgi:hypothetical protein
MCLSIIRSDFYEFVPHLNLLSQDQREVNIFMTIMSGGGLGFSSSSTGNLKSEIVNITPLRCDGHIYF